MTVLGVGEQGLIALVDPNGTTVLPIYVGGTEAASASHRFHGTHAPRPLTHDLMDALMHDLGAEVYRAQVDSLESGTYIGSLVVAENGRYIALDARPSDAIALAMGAKAPIVVARRVLDKAGVPKSSFTGLAEDDDALIQQMMSQSARVVGGSGSGPGTEPLECIQARLLKGIGSPAWAKVAAICTSKGGTP